MDISAGCSYFKAHDTLEALAFVLSRNLNSTKFANVKCRKAVTLLKYMRGVPAASRYRRIRYQSFAEVLIGNAQREREFCSREKHRLFLSSSCSKA